MIDANTSAFARLWALGYKRLLPIIPPDAEISENSLLYKRVGTTQDGRGKTPGTRGHNGKWYSFDWSPYEADEDDLTRWTRMGAGTGIKTGDGLVAIDADTLNVEHAKTIRDIVERHCGRLPIRVGKFPKALYLCRTDGPYKYTRVDFNDTQPPERVEVLTDGRQFVAHGTHPKTGKPYDWPRDLVPFDQLPVIPTATLDALMADLKDALPATRPIVKEGSDAQIDQRTLRGDPNTVRRAVEMTPNTSAHFATREAYRDFGYAIKASLPDDPELAFELFQDWCSRWEDGTNDPDTVESDWKRMKPPFRRGARWLYEQAEQHGSFSSAEMWFQPLDDGLFPEIGLNAPEERQPIVATPYGFPDPTKIQPRQWLYGTHYIRKFVSATVAPSGAGKTFLAVAEALAMASGKPLLGVPVHGRHRVWLWNGEDPMDELERRISAAMLHYGLTRDDIGDRLFVDTGRETEIVLAAETRDGAKIAAPVVSALLSTIRANRIDVVQIDPFVSTHRVSENDNGAIDLVAKQWAKIADAAGVSVELVHHVRKLNGAEVTVEDSRGASALLAAARPARALAKMTKAEARTLGLETVYRRLFRFGDGKNNLALPADERTEWMQLSSVSLGNGLVRDGSRLGSAESIDGLERLGAGDSVGVVTRFVMPDASASFEDSERGAALRLLAVGEWRKDVRSGDAWAGAAIGQALGLDVSDEADRTHAKALLTGWLHAGVLREVTRLDAQRRPRTFIEVVEKADSESENPGNTLFD